MIQQKLQAKMLQKLSPQQIQLMRLLQVPVMNLEQRIKQELEENPALEETEQEEEYEELYEPEDFDQGETRDTSDFDINDYLDEDDVATYKLKTNNGNESHSSNDYFWTSSKSAYDLLVEQMQMQGLTEKEYQIGISIIGNIDEDGYLTRNISSIVDDLAFSQSIFTNEQEVAGVLSLLQQLDPPGIAARSLQECLLLQLKRKENKTKSIVLATNIIEKMFDAFSKKHYAKIMEKFKVPENELRLAIDEIIKLNPKPGAAFGNNDDFIQYITPDYFLVNQNGTLQLTLNARNTPELKVSKGYINMLTEYSETKQPSKQQKETISFIKQRIDSAKGFIDAIKQRQETLMNTMQAILKIQYDYFLNGDVSLLKPMKLKDVADIVNMDVSTISRVVNNKYVQTHFGLFLLKEFFSQSTTTEAGEDVSVQEVKKFIGDFINDEDKNSPLTDEQINNLLNKKGFQLSRRTIAKYREAMGMPVARLRKEI